MTPRLGQCFWRDAVLICFVTLQVAYMVDQSLKRANS